MFRKLVQESDFKMQDISMETFQGTFHDKQTGDREIFDGYKI